MRNSIRKTTYETNVHSRVKATTNQEEGNPAISILGNRRSDGGSGNSDLFINNMISPGQTPG